MNVKDHSGSVINGWAILKKIGKSNGRALYLCRCRCGSEKEIYDLARIKTGRMETCGCGIVETQKDRMKGNTHRRRWDVGAVNEVGSVVVERDAKNIRFTCFCGNEKTCLAANFIEASCGCYHRAVMCLLKSKEQLGWY